MQSVVARYSRHLFVAVLLVGLDVVISLPIMGATYRPFSWMSIASADAATLYPVIQNLSLVDGAAAGDEHKWAAVTVGVSPGSRVTLQRSTNLLDAAAWRDVTSATATDQVILMIDTNPVSRAVYYRVLRFLGESP